MTDIAIVDYGMGNLRSVSKALEHVAPSVSVSVTGDPEMVRKADRVVVPGQGAMPECRWSGSIVRLARSSLLIGRTERLQSPTSS